MSNNCCKCGCKLRGKQIRVHNDAHNILCRQCYSLGYIEHATPHMVWIAPMLRRIGECDTIGELMSVYNAHKTSIDKLEGKSKALVMAAFSNVKEEISK